MFVDEFNIITQDDYIFNKGVNAYFPEKFDCIMEILFFSNNLKSSQNSILDCNDF